MYGVLNLFKPPGYSSHDMVQVVRKQLNEKRVGHCGTLDPGAAGLLVVLVGRATRIQEYLTCMDKVYVAELTFGLATDTGDGFGSLIEQGEYPEKVTHFEGVFSDFTGTIEQIPPMTSAIKHQGTPLYRLAHQGLCVEREPREVQVDSISMLQWRPGPPPRALLRIACSAGTYIRVLLSELARAAQSCGYMSFLVRERVGDFELGNAFVPGDISERVLIPLADSLDFMPGICLNQRDTYLASHGAAPRDIDLEQIPLHKPVKLIEPSGRLLAISEIVRSTDGVKQISLLKVFPSTI